MEEERLVNMCWREKEGNKENLYSMEREQYLNERGWSSRGIEIERGRGNIKTIELEQIEKDIQRQEEEEKIIEGK